jgi:hypothetical protein
VYAFAGEVYVDEGLVTLPSVFVQPENLEATLTNQTVKVPTEAALVEAWATFDEAAGGTDPPNMGELMSARLANENVDLPQVMVIPTLFIPLLIDRPTQEKLGESSRPR